MAWEIAPPSGNGDWLARSSMVFVSRVVVVVKRSQIAARKGRDYGGIVILDSPSRSLGHEVTNMGTAFSRKEALTDKTEGQVT